MKLNSSRTSRRHLLAEINVVPYIDVMLVLLIIFMATAPLLTAGVEVNLPKANVKILENQKEPLIISVDAHGLYYLNVGSNPTKPVAPSIAVRQVAHEYALSKATSPRAVLVKGDAKVPYEKVIHAMALLQKAGVPQVGLVTDEEQEVG